MEFHQAPLGKRPEGFDAVDMASAASKLVLPVMDSVVLLVAQIDEAVIAPPAIRVDDAVEVDPSPDNGLQRGLSAIRDDLGVDFSVSLEDAEDRCFAGGSTASFALDSLAAEVGFIDFDLTGKRRFMLAQFGDSLSDEVEVAIDRVAVEASKGSGLAGVQIEGVTAHQLPELGLGNS